MWFGWFRIVLQTVLVNGELPTDAFKRVTGYVAQDTVYFESLTVREVMRYGAELSLPSTTLDSHGNTVPMTKAMKYAKVDKIIEMLDIGKCADSRIGNAADSGGISGGERRRLAVGMEVCVVSCRVVSCRVVFRVGADGRSVTVVA